MVASATVTKPLISPSEPKNDFPFPRVTITRGDDVALEIELSLGDITETPSRVIC
ncbi:MAG: hypothetical protein HC767_13615 [Akkermansiaceae bacterium]|nr:hypothetical protein [Akkermansiaceae bacterium]